MFSLVVGTVHTSDPQLCVRKEQKRQSDSVGVYTAQAHAGPGEREAP